MLGQPKFKYGARVRFTSQQEEKVGIVFIVDACGSWIVPKEPSYDIMTAVKDGICLYKHIAEQYIADLGGDETHNEELLYIEARIS